MTSWLLPHTDFHYRCQLHLKPSFLWQLEQPGDIKMTEKGGQRYQYAWWKEQRSGFLFALNLNSFSADEWIPKISNSWSRRSDFNVFTILSQSRCQISCQVNSLYCTVRLLHNNGPLRASTWVVNRPQPISSTAKGLHVFSTCRFYNNCERSGQIWIWESSASRPESSKHTLHDRPGKKSATLVFQESFGAKGKSVLPTALDFKQIL